MHACESVAGRHALSSMAAETYVEKAGLYCMERGFGSIVGC